ncbi:MAG: hemolysin III family protein [Alphaproteobacteria bacterium]|nr:hemolysin III family protein [Alphaproteobacteria bacterium]
MTTAAASQDYSIGEEIAHAVSHGLAALAAMVGLVFLVMKAAETGGAVEVTAAAMYAGCMVFMFTASTLYHSFFMTRARAFLKMLDHSAIYFKIAGTYTPFALVTLPTALGGWVMAGVWSAALLGTALKARAFFKKTAKKFSAVSLTLYLAMGWAAVLMMGELSDRLPEAAINWIIAGGLAYTVGAIFYALKKIRYTHAIWHGFVVAGAACHFVAIYQYVI